MHLGEEKQLLELHWPQSDMRNSAIWILGLGLEGCMSVCVYSGGRGYEGCSLAFEGRQIG